MVFFFEKLITLNKKLQQPVHFLNDIDILKNPYPFFLRINRSKIKATVINVTTTTGTMILITSVKIEILTFKNKPILKLKMK